MAKVLIVDDAGFIRRWCTSTLGEDGHTVFEASNAGDGVRAYREQRPDVGVLDVTMPVMDGLTALGEIRKADPEAKVVMPTSEGQMSRVLQARRLGARDFIVKPCESARLIASIERVLSS